MRRFLHLRLIYALCLCRATGTHLQVVLVHGLWWDYGGAAPLTRIHWTSLLCIDPLTALLLPWRPEAGPILCVAVIVSDVVHNSWFALHHPIRMDLYLSQVVFLLFVACTVRTSGKGPRVAPPHCASSIELPDCLFVQLPVYARLHVSTTYRHQHSSARLNASVSCDEPQNAAMDRARV
ncbi:MAG TPA: hypothetical protein VHV99_04065 [Paraburkholderia sp.]|jgi:hypothetical protein|nr:hypothetical protein [Paraburkholderia sp.]